MISKLAILSGAVLALAAGAAYAQETLPPQPAALVRNVCADCHGLHGRSVMPVFPNLAGQPAAYIESQLRQFRDESRADPNARGFMWGVASRMSDAMIDGVAQYYARQKPATGAPQKPALVAAGRKLFQSGDPKDGISACQSCHGAEGQGMGPFPRLAGQHRDYLFQQLIAFQTQTRQNAIMHATSHRMTPEQMQELTAYLASL